MGNIVMGQETACGGRRWRAVVFQDRSKNRRAIERREEWTESWDKTGVLRGEPERAIGTSEERSVERTGQYPPAASGSSRRMQWWWNTGSPGHPKNRRRLA